MVTKTSYKTSFKKRVVQNRIFSSIKGKYTNLVGLGGPDINDYLTIVKKIGIKQAVLYEHDNSVLLKQVSTLKPVIPTRVIYNDIIEQEPGQKKTIYDLDFCCSALSAYTHLKKFSKDPTITTLSIRPIGTNKTIENYLKAVTGTKKYRKVLVSKTSDYLELNLVTTKKTIKCYLYKDSSPMLVFIHL
jgi:hypothetical protein